MVLLRELKSTFQFCFYAVKKVRRFNGKIPGIWLTVHSPLYFLESACRTLLDIAMLEITIW